MGSLLIADLRASPYLYSAALRSFDSVLIFQIIHFLIYDVFLRSPSFASNHEKHAPGLTLNLEP